MRRPPSFLVRTSDGQTVSAAASQISLLGDTPQQSYPGSAPAPSWQQPSGTVMRTYFWYVLWSCLFSTVALFVLHMGSQVTPP